jgi:hypothetical protein
MLAIYLIRPSFFFGGGIILLELRFISVEEREIIVSAKKVEDKILVHISPPKIRRGGSKGVGPKG